MSRDLIGLPAETTAGNMHKVIVVLVIALVGISAGSVACVSNRGTSVNLTNAPASGTTTASATRSNPDVRSDTPPTPHANAQVANEMTLASQPLRAKAAGELVLEVALPEGYHLNDEAPQHYEATVTSGAEHLAFTGGSLNLTRTSKSLELPLRLPLVARTEGAAQVRVAFKIFFCRYAAGGSCRVKTLTWNVPVEVTVRDDAPQTVIARSVITL